ncbi:hypothetical protein PVK06_002461 [Gossypium arboreum]|uniref:Uncharacterized protein n=1 Tax=Gossypium arboreum TaxID=29729 RepID=A0ABR0R4Y7_GOSAR|nr:hypothetical protein PVK06_002461 [Gossypium arboreum]
MRTRKKKKKKKKKRRKRRGGRRKKSRRKVQSLLQQMMQLAEHEHKLIEMNSNSEKLQQTYNELLEFKMVFLKDFSSLVLSTVGECYYKVTAEALRMHTLAFCSSVLDSLEVELKASKDFSKLYAGIAILWLHLSLYQPSVVYCFFFFSDLFL